MSRFCLKFFYCIPCSSTLSRSSSFHTADFSGLLSFFFYLFLYIAHYSSYLNLFKGIVCRIWFGLNFRFGLYFDGAQNAAGHSAPQTKVSLALKVREPVTIILR